MTPTKPDLVTLRAPEVRTFSPNLDLRAVDGTESGTFLEGVAVPYDTWADIGWFMERHMPGSFKKSIREAAKGLPLLLWHDNQTFPVGVSDEWRDEGDALRCVWRIDQTDDRARTAAQKARDGFLTGLSIGFAPVGEPEVEIDDNGVVWVTRRESRLLEVSLTPTPAFAGAQVSLVRSRMEHQGKPRRSAELDAWRNYLQGVTR